MANTLISFFTKIVVDPKNIGRLCDFVGEMPNIKFRTLGGLFFWDNLASEKGYKLQKNKLTGHCRVLDTENNRIAWGSEENLLEIMKKVIQ